MDSGQRQQRQASQEVQKRRALLQRLADRKQGSRLVLDSSSDSDRSDSEEAADSAHSGSRFCDENIASNSFRSSQVEAPAEQRKVLKRLSQQRDQLPRPSQAEAVHGSRLQQDTMSNSFAADEGTLLKSLSNLTIDHQAGRPQPASTLAAAVATRLPDELRASQDADVPAALATKASQKQELSADSEEPKSSSDADEFRLKPKIANMLYKHQVEGVQWLRSLHKMKRGGILGMQTPVFGANRQSAC